MVLGDKVFKIGPTLPTSKTQNFFFGADITAIPFRETQKIYSVYRKNTERVVWGLDNALFRKYFFRDGTVGYLVRTYLQSENYALTEAFRISG